MENGLRIYFHGNMPATLALEKEISRIQPDDIWFLGLPRCHALLIEGELGSSELVPISFNILSIPYDNNLAVRIADEYPDLPGKEAYKNELLTGVYSRS